MGEVAGFQRQGPGAAWGTPRFWRGHCWGVLGAFFAGLNTISDLTSGPIQDSTAGRMGLDRTTILALQSVGGAMGNMVAIHNIMAV